MRTWRKIYASILDSESLAGLSDEAALLFMFLIAAQDDDGFYPWTPTKIRRLIAVRPDWTLEQVQSMADELINTELACFQDNGIILAKGSELNGHPRSDVEYLSYRKQDAVVTDTPRIQSDNATETLRNETTPLEKSRVEKSRVEKSRIEQLPGIDEVYRFYTSEKFGKITPTIKEEIRKVMLNQLKGSDYSGVTVEEFIEAMREAVRNGVHKLQYVKAILRDKRKQRKGDTSFKGLSQ